MARERSLDPATELALRESLVAAMETHAWSQRDVALKIGVTQQTVSNFVQGKYGIGRGVADRLTAALRSARTDPAAANPNHPDDGAARIVGSAFDPARHDIRASALVLATLCAHVDVSDARGRAFCAALFDAWTPSVASTQSLLAAALLARVDLVEARP